MTDNEDLQRIQALEQRYEAMDCSLAAMARQSASAASRRYADELLVQELNRAVKLLRKEVKDLRDPLAVMQNGGSLL